MPTPKYVPQTRLVYVVQGKYPGPHGWEDECIEDTRRECKQTLKEYRENSPYPVRFIKRRIRIDTGERYTKKGARDGRPVRRAFTGKSHSSGAPCTNDGCCGPTR